MTHIRECLICKKPVLKGRKYCSPQCYHKSPFKGKPPIKPRASCVVCGKPVPRVVQKFCSRECYGKHQIGRERPQAYKRIEKTCPICGIKFITGGTVGRKNQIYCSRNCNNKSRRKPVDADFQGKALWKELRLKIIERDNYRCQLCGLEKKPQQLQIHHIIPVDVELNFEEKNLITCCVKCHYAIDVITQLAYQNNKNFDPFSLIGFLRRKE